MSNTRINLIKYKVASDNNSKLPGMVTAMPPNSLNIRLTIHFAPNYPGIINFCENEGDIWFYIIPKIKETHIYNLLLSKYSDNWKNQNLKDICSFILRQFYLKDY